MRTRIKICGITRVTDAMVAARAGADAIGMIFYPPAPRNIPLDRAKEILAALPAFVTPVGLFVDADNAAILKTADQLRLRHVQLHGDETPQQVAGLNGLKVIKAIRVDANLIESLTKWRGSGIVGVVLETAGTKESGGTGIANDWAAVKKAKDQGAFGDLPIIAAGGLRPDSVAAVVREIHPFAVDVSSSVERVRGEKSADLIEAFVAAVRNAQPQSQS